MIFESDLKESKRYSVIKTKIFFIDIFITTMAFGAFQMFLARPVSLFSQSMNGNFYISCLTFSSLFLLFMYVISLPLSIYSSFYIEHHFNLSRQKLLSWCFDEVKSLIITYLLSILCILGFYVILRNFQNTWWIISALSWIFLTIILVRFVPVFVIPLFYKYIPIEDEELLLRIKLIAQKSGINLSDVCQIDFSRKTVKANAALVGLGSTRKVILSDTLIADFSLDEIEAVLAHEFGHFKYKHIWKLLLSSSVISFAGFFVLSLLAEKIVFFAGVKSLSDIYLLPVLVFLMLCFGIIMMPFQNLFSRILERQADRFALEITDSSASFIRVMSKLAKKNLADSSPSNIKKIFLFDHPPISERIQMAEKYETRKQTSI